MYLEEEYKISHKYFQGFRKKPLYKLSNGNYIVLDWNLVTDQLYNTLLFDFHKKCNIEDPIIKFKNDVRSSKLIENSIFPICLESIFPNRNKILLFDKDLRQIKNSVPDGYLRFGKKIFLFEIKDAFFNSNVINQVHYDDIKKEIDKKYNCIDKGIGQFIKQIEYLDNGNSFENIKIDYSKYELYPILIYTDDHFGLPGIDQYLAEEMESKLKEESLEKTFKKIARLSFLPIDFFIANHDELKKTEYRLDKVINKAFNILKRRKRDIEKRDSIITDKKIRNANRSLEEEIFILFPNFGENNIKSMKLLERLNIIEKNQI